MHIFLEIAASTCNAVKDFLSEKFFIMMINKYTTLIVLFTIGMITGQMWIIMYPILLFIGLMAKQLIDAKSTAFRVEYFDKDCPALLKEIITDAINEYYIYHFSNMSGDIPYINSDQEVEINHGVVDILLARLEGSAMLDKLKLYYGTNFNDVLVIQANLTITDFVVKLNSTEQPRKKKIRAGVDNLSKENISSFISSMGFNKIQ